MSFVDLLGNQNSLSNPTYTAGGYIEQASLSAAVLNADLVPSTDVSAYKWWSLQVTGAWSGTLTFQGSNDNSTWNSVIGYNAGGQTVGASTLTANALYGGPVQYRYLRVRMTSYSSGTANGTLELYTVAPAVWETNVSISPSTSGGTSDYHLISAATTNSNNIKASGGQIYGYDLGNNGASDAWVKFYNKATAPTIGTDTPFRVVYVPKGSRASFHSTTGLALGTGIGIGVTGGAADSDTTAVASAQVTVEVDYK